MPRRKITSSRAADLPRGFRIGDSFAINRGAVDPYDDYLVYDTFIDSNGLALPSHVPNKDAEGGGWVTAAGTPTINNNTVVNSGLTRFYIELATQYQELEVQVRAQASFLRCELRWTSSAWKLGVLLRDDINAVAVYRYAGAGAVPLSTPAYTFTTGVFYSVVIKFGSDGFVVLSIDGTEIVNVEEGNTVGTGTKVHFEMPAVGSPSWAIDNLGIKAAS